MQGDVLQDASLLVAADVRRRIRLHLSCVRLVTSAATLDALLSRIAEADILINDVPANRHLQNAPAVAAFLGHVEDVEHAGGGGAGGLEDLIQSMQAADRIVEKHSGVEHERDEL